MNTTEKTPAINPYSLLSPKGLIEHGTTLVALKLDIFECLKDDFLTLIEIKQKLDLKLRERNLWDFLDKLYFMNHLLREGNDITNVKYKTAHNHLIKSNPDNFIPLVHMAERINRRLDILPFMIKEGKFPENHGLFEELFSDEQRARDFLRTMALLQKNNFETISKELDFTKNRKMVDIGGCLGAFSVSMKNHNPHLNCINYDLPYVESHSRKYLEEKNMSNLIEIVSGDMFKDDFPKCDVIGMGNILHDWNDEKKRLLLKKAYDCLDDEGIMIVVEAFMKDERDVEDVGSNISYLMLIECLDGFNMTRKEMESYAKETGFKKVEFLKEKIGVDAAVLYKGK